jgi:hypothetical protein
MLCEHLGEIVEVQDPAKVSYENAIIRCLRKHGPSRQNDVYIHTAGRRVGHEAFLRVIDELVQRGIVTRLTTNRRNSFVLRMASPKHSLKKGNSGSRTSVS